MFKLTLGAMAAALALLSFPVAHSADVAAPARANPVPGEKLDSGLGEMPPYREWAKHPTLKALVVGKSAHHVPGEKLDSGLGEMPPYREWAKHPTLKALVVGTSGLTVSVEKRDSGSGQLPVVFRQ